MFFYFLVDLPPLSSSLLCRSPVARGTQRLPPFSFVQEEEEENPDDEPLDADYAPGLNAAEAFAAAEAAAAAANAAAAPPVLPRLPPWVPGSLGCLEFGQRPKTK